MTNTGRGQTAPATDWRSDAAIAYAILRFTFGVNIGLRGIMRIANGTDVFAGDLLKQFAAAPIPLGPVEAFGHVVPWIEAAIGLMLMLGAGTRVALIAGGLMMTSLTFGAMLLQNFQLAWLQLTYSGVFFLLLVLRSWNAISVDALTQRSPGAPERVPARF